MIKYHPEHTWVRLNGDTALIGLTFYAQAHLGEIVYVDLPPEGETVISGLALGEIESTKTTSDVIAPISGRVVEANMALEKNPSLINESPLENGWIIRIKPSKEQELELLLDLKSYEAFLADQQAGQDEK